MRQISSSRPVFQNASWNFAERDAAFDRYSVFDPMTNHEAADIRMSRPSTPLTTGRGVQDERDDVEPRFASAGLQDER